METRLAGQRWICKWFYVEDLLKIRATGDGRPDNYPTCDAVWCQQNTHPLKWRHCIPICFFTIVLSSFCFCKNPKLCPDSGQPVSISAYKLARLPSFRGLYSNLAFGDHSQHRKNSINPTKNDDTKIRIASCFPPETASIWNAAERCFDRPWFSRVWTYREVVLNKTSTVVWSLQHFLKRLVRCLRSYHLRWIQ